MSVQYKCDSDLCCRYPAQRPLPAGWLIVTQITAKDTAVEERHFCSVGCLSYWATKRNNEEEARDG